MDATISHIDTCLPCFLQDHHSREGECLLAVPVDCSTRVWQVKNALRDELRGADLPSTAVHDAARVALENLFAGTQPFQAFDPYLERAEDDGIESVYAYFVLRW